MHRNEAAQLILQDQVDDVSMETRIAKFESDMGHLKKTVAQIAVNVSALQVGLIAANEATAALKTELVKTTGELRTEIGSVRSELKAEIGNVRTELKAEIASVRTELKAEIASVRIELKAEKTELKEDIARLRTDTQIGFGKVREEISAIKATLPQFATKADLSAMETRIIKWFVFTAVAIGTLAFSIAKFVS